MNAVHIREPSGRAGASTTTQPPREAVDTIFHLPPRQSLDVSEEVNEFAVILARGLKTPPGVIIARGLRTPPGVMITHDLRTPNSAIAKWLGELPDQSQLGPNEHFAVGEYDDEHGHRKSAVFVCENVNEQPQDKYPDWTHPRTPPMPPTLPTKIFNPNDFLNRTPTQAEHVQDITDQQTSFKSVALNSVTTSKVVLKRFAKTTGKVLDQIAVMPDYNTPRPLTSRDTGPSISGPFQAEASTSRPFTSRNTSPSISVPFETNSKGITVTTISLAEAQAREQARKANFQRKQTSQTPSKPLERRQIGNPNRQTRGEDFQTYQTPPHSQEEANSSQAVSLSPPRIPEHMNKPSRKPLPSKAPSTNLNKSLPESPSTDSLRRRTQMPPGVQTGIQPNILAVPVLRDVVQSTSRNVVDSQYGVVFESSESEEKVSWPGTPAEFEQGKGKQAVKARWWEFEGSSEEQENVVDPTRKVWERMEESMRNGGGIRRSDGGRGGGGMFWGNGKFSCGE